MTQMPEQNSTNRNPGAQRDHPDAAEHGGSLGETMPGTISVTTESVAVAVPGDIVAQRYRVIRMLGKGGMGEVFQAQDLTLGKTVALKFISPRLSRDREVHQRFLDEVRLTQEVSHANVCRVFDIHQHDTTTFLSMEYVDGEDLASLVRRIGRLEPGKASEVAAEVCAGLAAAHQKQILHRDLKPSNVLLDGQGRVKIVDFGLASIFGSQPDYSGTPGFMAPEQIESGTSSVRTDVFSLGLVLHFLFTGIRATRSDDGSARVSPTLHDSNINPLASQVIASCLQRDSDSRPSNVADVAQAFPAVDRIERAHRLGITPSVESIADSRVKEMFSSPLVAAMVIGLLAGLAAVFALSKHGIVGSTSVEHPQVLIHDAKNVMESIGYDTEPQDTAWGFQFASSVIDAKNNTVEPSPIQFWYRESQAQMWPRRFFDRGIKRQGGRVTYDDPVLAPGMVSMKATSAGELVELIARPTLVQNAQGASPTELLKRHAATLEIDPHSIAEKSREFDVPVPYHSATVFHAVSNRSGNVEILAATLGNRLVYFRATPQESSASFEFVRSAHMDVDRASVIFILLLAVTAWIGVRNYRNRLADRSSAARMGIFMTLAALAYVMLYASHTRSITDESLLLHQSLAWVAFFGVHTWLSYLALEPFMRQYWPRELVSWSRLMQGRFRDPLVGKHLCIGVLMGLAVRVVELSFASFSSEIDSTKLYVAANELMPLLGVFGALAQIAGALCGSILSGLFLMLTLVLCRATFRSRNLAAAAFCVLWVLLVASGFAWERILFAALFVAPGAYVVIRHGLFPWIAGFFVASILSWPITSDIQNWYFWNGAASLLIAAGLAAIGFWLMLPNEKSVSR